jgi:hypothetical protein
MTRGVVLPLTQQQRVQRMLYLAGLCEVQALDPHVRWTGAPKQKCPDIFYLLRDHNGGKDPTAADPADRWSKEGSTFTNRTADCIGGAAWCGGFDRYQPVRFAHRYSGWINTDSMRMDANVEMKCFIRLSIPEPGCFVVYASDPQGKTHGKPVGHIGCVIATPAEWDEKSRESWADLEVVDVASRSPRPANQLTTGLGWYGKNAWFVRSVMKP